MPTNLLGRLQTSDTDGQHCRLNIYRLRELIFRTFKTQAGQRKTQCLDPPHRKRLWLMDTAYKGQPHPHRLRPLPRKNVGYLCLFAPNPYPFTCSLPKASTNLLRLSHYVLDYGFYRFYFFYQSSYLPSHKRTFFNVPLHDP